MKSLSLQRVRNKPLPYLQGKGKKPRVYLAAGFVKHVKHGFSWAGRIQEQQESPRAAFKHFKLSTDSGVTPESPGRQIQLGISPAWEVLGSSSRNAGAGLCSGHVLGSVTTWGQQR